MKTLENIFAFALIIIAFLPITMVFNDNADSAYINFIGLGYGWLLYRYGKNIAPKCVKDLLEKMDADAEKWA